MEGNVTDGLFLPPRGITRASTAREIELAGDLRQQVSSHPRDARHALLQHDLQQGGAAERRIRLAQELSVAPGLWSDQEKRAVRAQNSLQPLQALRLTAQRLAQEPQGLCG